MKKKFLCFITLLCMMVNIISPLSVKALGMYDCVKVDKIEYMFMGSYMQVQWCDDDISGDIVVPSTVEGYPVTTVFESAFWGKPGITSITLPSSVTRIDLGAFQECTSLKSVTIPASVTYIDEYAFYDNQALTDIYFGGTKAQWDALGSILYIDHVTVHYGSGGAPSINVHKTDIDAMGKNVENELNSLLKSVTLCDTTIKGPSFEINGNVITPLEFDAKAVLDLSGLSKCITIDTDKKTVHVILGKLNEDGKASVVQTTKTCDASWGKQYSEIKDLYKKMIGGDMSSRKNWNNFEKLKGELNSIKCDMFIEAEMQCVAYLDFDYQTGSLRLSEGGFVESASLGVNFNYPLIGKCLYATLGLKGSEEGTIKAVVTSSGEINPQMSIKPSLTAKGSITGEIPMLCNAEGGIDATLAVLLQTFDPKLTVTMGGKIFLEAKVFNKSLIDWSHPYVDVELYPEFKANAEGASLMSFGDTSDIYNNAVSVPRDYLYSVMPLSVNADAVYEMHGVYPDNNVQLVSFGDGSMMLIWVGDDGSKSDINRTSLMYSICSDGEWSEAATIAEDGSAVGQFEVVSEEDKLYVVYQKLSGAFDDDVSVEEMLASSDLYFIEYENGVFTEPVCINDEGNTAYEYICETGIVWGMPAVFWIENSCNDVFLANGETLVNAKVRQDGEWSETETLFGAYGEEGSYPGEVHLDGEGMYFTMINSYEDYTGTMLISSSENVVSEYYTDDAIYNAEVIDGRLYYIKNSSIYCLIDEVETAVGFDNVTSFKAVSEGENTSMLMCVPEGAGNELYISSLVDGEWTRAERFTDMGKYIRSYSPIMEDGAVKLVVSAAEVNDEIEDGGDVYGATSIMVLEQCEYLDLSSTYVYYDETAVKPDSDIELYFDVYNDSANALETVNVVITDDSGAVLCEQSIDCDIAPYASSELSIKYHLPKEMAKTQLNLSASAEGEKSYENNMVSTDIGYANVTTSEIGCVVNADKTADISTTVTNTGFSDAEAVVVRIYNGSINGEVLQEINVGNLLPGESVDVEYIFPAELMTTDENAMNAVYVLAESASEESSYADNEQKAAFGNDVTEPTATPTAEPTATPTVEPTATPTVEPTATPTVEPTATPTVEPTATPTVEPTATPTVEPTATPTVEPTATPTVEPTATPTVEPTATPTVEPTATPTVEPTATPTVEPTATPTVEPTATPTVEPTATPAPTMVPEPAVKITALYDADGRLVSISIEDIMVTGEEVFIPEEGQKIFIWKSLEGMMPWRVKGDAKASPFFMRIQLIIFTKSRKCDMIYIV